METQTTEKYEQLPNGDWIYRIYDDYGDEMTNSLNIPPFSNRADAESSAFGWLLQNGLV